MSSNPTEQFRSLADRPPEEATFFWGGGPVEVAPRTFYQCAFSSCTGFETDEGWC